MHEIVTDDEIFSASAYELPIPSLDGRKADKLTVGFSGSVSSTARTSTTLALVEALAFGGRHLTDRDFGGKIAVTASDDVREAMRAAADAESAFVYAVDQYRRSKRGAKVESENPGFDMHNAREAAFAAIQHAQTVMRDELADL